MRKRKKIMLKAFEYIADKNSRVLILGSMPSVISLEKKEYYGNPNNSFWKIMFILFGNEYSNNFENKKKLLLKNGIALWDVLSGCERKGSSDANIKKPVANDFESFFNTFTSIHTVFFNGQAAARFYKALVLKVQDVPELEYICLPSTSPLHTIPVEKKLEKYIQIRDSLSN